MRLMRILVFVEYLPPKLGSDRRIFEIMRRLTKRHEIHFIVFPPFRSLRDSRLVSDKRTSSASDERTAFFEGIYAHRIEISPMITRLWQRSLILAYMLTTLSVLMKSSSIFRKIDPDVVVLNYPSPYTGLLGFLEGRLWKKKVIVDFNDLIAQYSNTMLRLGEASVMAKLTILVQTFIIRNSDRMIAPTRFIKKYAESQGVPQKRMSLIPNGADVNAFNLNKVKLSQTRKTMRLTDKSLCVYSGRLDGWAGINIILRLCNIARKKRPDIRFLLVGSGQNQEIHGENITYLGEIPHENVPSLLATADVILIPFPNDEVAHAASPLKLFEGMSMQKPVVASRVSGIQDVIRDGENGFLADPDSPEEWMLKIETVLDSKEVAARVGKNAKRTVEDSYDWNMLTRQCEEVLNVS